MNIFGWFKKKKEIIEEPEQYVPIDDIRVAGFALAQDVGRQIVWVAAHGTFADYVQLQKQYKELTGGYYEL